MKALEDILVYFIIIINDLKLSKHIFTQSSKMLSLFVDADACPVKQEIIKVAERYKLKTFIVSNGGIRPYRNPFVKYVYVADGLDEADNWIERNCNNNSISYNR